MALDPITAGIDLANNIGGKLIDRLFPDKLAQASERAAAEAAIANIQNDAEIRRITAQLSAIVAEATSTDPWTSRSRPMFLYVIYIMLLMAIPMGFIEVFRPGIGLLVAAGFKAWLMAIPDSLYALFGAGYLGYTGARTLEKRRGVAARA
jgi:hypothetical protein